MSAIQLTQPDWAGLALQSHTETAYAIQNALAVGDVVGAEAGIAQLADALSRADTRSLRSFLELLMAHIYKWQLQPERRSNSWVASIREARLQIETLREDEPRLRPRSVLESLWERSCRIAWLQAHKEMNREVPRGDVPLLTWEQVMEAEYSLNTGD